MTITSSTLFRAASIAAAAAGLIFIGLQINTPHLDATSITTADVMTRDSLKVFMAALALGGITGLYLRQVTEIGRPRRPRLLLVAQGAHPGRSVRVGPVGSQLDTVAAK